MIGKREIKIKQKTKPKLVKIPEIKLKRKDKENESHASCNHVALIRYFCCVLKTFAPSYTVAQGSKLNGEGKANRNKEPRLQNSIFVKRKESSAGPRVT